MTDLTECLTVYQYDKKYRLGVNGDGGYVLADLEKKYDCYISAGISNEESFSRDFLSKHNIDKEECFGFDGTIHQYPENYNGEKLQFIKKNINFYNDDANTNLTDIIENHNDIFLKMDIEGGEFNWIVSLSEEQLSKFSQIVMEVHWIYNDSIVPKEIKKQCLEKLSKTHYLVHIHGNNNENVYSDGFPPVVELTYIHKNYFDVTPPLNTTPLPIDGLDFPNKKGVSDINLNFYPFVHT